jgi:hypothetical protein
MTCIVGLLDPNNDCVYIGADSLGSSWCSQAIYKNRKVFKGKNNNNLLMAISGDYKLQNILSVEENIIEELVHLKDQVNFEYMVKNVAPKILNLAKQYNCTKTEDGYMSLDGNVIVGYKNQLYIIEPNC